jgi:dihydroneopterin aldolase
LTPARSDVIELRGLLVAGRHGLLEEERQRAQPFEVDLDLKADLSGAAGSDDLDSTIDYGSVVNAVAAVVAETHSELMENLASRILDAVFDTVSGAPGAAILEEVTVWVRKTRPPVPYPMASAGVRLTRRSAQR